MKHITNVRMMQATSSGDLHKLKSWLRWNTSRGVLGMTDVQETFGVCNALFTIPWEPLPYRHPGNHPTGVSVYQATVCFR